jgi:peptide/nickel transport system substrate-binding protein
MTEREGDRTPGQQFDRKMAAYVHDLLRQAFSRRGLFRMTATAAGAAALATGARPFLPGLTVLAQDGDTINFGLDSDPRGIEPALGYDFTANIPICNITEGLMALDDNNALYPLLAEKFEQPDPLTYVYTMRDGVKFHDGSVMTVADSLASIDRVRNPKMASQMAWMFEIVDTITQTGDKQLTIKLKSASGSFQYVAAVTAMHVMPKSLIDTTPDTQTQSPIGTGPYKFVKWEAGSQIELEKNADYWQTGKPYFAKAVFKIVTDPTTRSAGLKTGDLNMVQAVPPDQVDVIKGIENVDLLNTIGFTINMIALRQDKPPFDDPKVREAVSKAIDVDSLLATFIKDTGVRSHATTVPPNMAGTATDQLQPVPFDVEAAKQALAASSQPNGFKTTLLVDAEAPQRVGEAQAVQQMLKEINVDAEILKIPQAERITRFQQGDYEGMAFHEWGADFPDANGMLRPLFSSKFFPPSNNQSYYSNPAVDKLLDDAESELDPEKRTQMLIDAQKQIAADYALIWLDHPIWFLVLDKNLTGYRIHPLFYWDSFLRDLKPAQ